MKGKLRGLLDRRQEMRIQNENEKICKLYTWIKCQAFVAAGRLSSCDMQAL